MAPQEFKQLADKMFEHLEVLLEQWQDDLDIDFESPSEGIIEVLFDNGSPKMVINQHNPMQELWIACKRGGFHFQYDEANQRWFSQRDQLEFLSCLEENVKLQAS